MPNLPFRYKTLVITAKHYGETDIKHFLSFPLLLHFFTLNHYFFPGLHLLIIVSCLISILEVMKINLIYTIIKSLCLNNLLEVKVSQLIF